MEPNDTDAIRHFHYAIIAETYPRILDHFGKGKNQKHASSMTKFELFGAPESLEEINPVYLREPLEKHRARLTN